jgi:dolichol-phosphate mannosyltransferase
VQLRSLVHDEERLLHADALQLVTLLGGLFFLGSIAMGLETLYMKIYGHAVDGFTTVILLQLIIGSALMFSLGIIGTYLARIYDEVKGRPRYLIRDLKEFGKSKSSE